MSWFSLPDNGRFCDRLFKAAEVVDYKHDVVCKRGSRVDDIAAMPSEQQQKVFAPVEDVIRRVIVATNIAATSITINGIVRPWTVVISSKQHTPLVQD